jgi:hypothetical protein
VPAAKRRRRATKAYAGRRALNDLNESNNANVNIKVARSSFSGHPRGSRETGNDIGAADDAAVVETTSVCGLEGVFSRIEAVDAPLETNVHVGRTVVPVPVKATEQLRDTGFAKPFCPIRENGIVAGCPGAGIVTGLAAEKLAELRENDVTVTGTLCAVVDPA